MHARSVFILAVAAGIASQQLCGQVSVVRSGSLEIGPFLGASAGSVNGYDFVAGGNITYALNRSVLPYFEYSYFLLPPTSHLIFSQANTSGPQVIASSFTLPLSDIHAGVHVRIPIKESPIVPYLVGGFGVLSHPQRVGDVVLGTPGSSFIHLSVPVPQGSDPTVNFGGGIRYYLGASGRFGVRAEAKVYDVVSGGFKGTFGKVEAGFFFQLR